jgi:solute carrier family 25 phosphate transporter 23/24/25/41
MAASAATVRYGPAVTITPQVLTEAAVKRPPLQYEGAQQSGAPQVSDIVEEEETAGITTRLTDLLPEPGYFLAGAVSGGVSRTATAPLDRLKVYLLVNIKPQANVALDAAKSGRPLAALRNAGGPIVDAVVSLWKTGGLRTFFAGMLR